jgi:threonine/homoserine/homoserine lactone efflux protein
MDTNQLISFALISLGFIAIPGPNILVIISISMTAGKVRGLQTVVGTSLAMFIQLIIAAGATSWLLSLLIEGLFWLKWCSVGYLLWIGILSFRKFSEVRCCHYNPLLGLFRKASGFH